MEVDISAGDARDVVRDVEMASAGDDAATESGDTTGITDSIEDEDEGISTEERLALALSCKDAGNGYLKGDNHSDARDKYLEGLKHVKSLTSPPMVIEIKKSLCLNLSLAHNKLAEWREGIQAATDALALEPNNVKALYRRAVARSRTGDYEAARADLMAVVAAEPGNVEARKEMAAVKRHIAEAKKISKKTYGGMFTKAAGGLYADREEEQRERERRREEMLQREKEEWEQLNHTRREQGEEEITFDDWKKSEEDKSSKSKKSSSDDTSSTIPPSTNTSIPSVPSSRAAAADDDDELDEEESKILEETKRKGYCYFKREKTGDERQTEYTPTRIESSETSAATSPASGDTGGGGTSAAPSASQTGKKSLSSWNARGTTWEEKDKTKWAKDKLRQKLSAVRIKQSPLEELTTSPGKMQDTLDKILNAFKHNDPLSHGDKLAQLGDLTSACIPMDAKVTEVINLEGDASVAMVSGSRRFLYDFEFQVAWEVVIDELPDYLHGDGGGNSKTNTRKYTGSMSFADVSSSVTAGLHWTADGRTTYDKHIPEAQYKTGLDAMIKKLKTAIAEAVQEFEKDFRATA